MLWSDPAPPGACLTLSHVRTASPGVGRKTAGNEPFLSGLSRLCSSLLLLRVSTQTAGPGRAVRQACPLPSPPPPSTLACLGGRRCAQPAPAPWGREGRGLSRRVPGLSVRLVPRQGSGCALCVCRVLCACVVYVVVVFTCLCVCVHVCVALVHVVCVLRKLCCVACCVYMCACYVALHVCTMCHVMLCVMHCVRVWYVSMCRESSHPAASPIPAPDGAVATKGPRALESGMAAPNSGGIFLGDLRRDPRPRCPRLHRSRLRAASPGLLSLSPSRPALPMLAPRAPPSGKGEDPPAGGLGSFSDHVPASVVGERTVRQVCWSPALPRLLLRCVTGGSAWGCAEQSRRWKV